MKSCELLACPVRCRHVPPGNLPKTLLHKVTVRFSLFCEPSLALLAWFLLYAIAIVGFHLSYAPECSHLMVHTSSQRTTQAHLHLRCPHLLLQALQELHYDSKIAFVVVQKRHNIRLKPRDGDYQWSSGRQGNLKQGVAVDSGIVDPKRWEFYLNSQAPLQGTNRPSRYIVLKDEIGFSRDGMMLFINSFCYTFARATR